MLSNIHRMMMCLVAAWTMLAVNAAETEKQQTPSATQPTVVLDSLLSAAGGAVAVDTVSMLNADSIYILNKVDSVGVKQKKAKRDWATWSPDPKRAMWLAIVLPGAGQVYNRKYWKLPIVYGGFLGCIYAWRWNNQMFRDYSQAYMDIMDDDPNTQSYNQFLHLGMQITDENKERYQNLFKRRKDYYRKYRDLSIFCMIGVYALSVIDAYVDASLSQFDISKDLSLKIEPSVMNDRRSANPLKSSALGLQCSLNF